MKVRLKETDKGWIVEQEQIKWSLFGLKTKWIPYVKTSGMDCAWVHKTKELAIISAIDELKLKLMRYGREI